MHCNAMAELILQEVVMKETLLRIRKASLERGRRGITFEGGKRVRLGLFSLAWLVVLVLLGRCLALVCIRFSMMSHYTASMLFAFSILSTNIMAHTEMQNTVWLPVYDHLPDTHGPPCPECFPNKEGSWIFGLSFSYVLLFLLPFRCSDTIDNLRRSICDHAGQCKVESL